MFQSNEEKVKAPKIPFICDDGDTPYEDYKCGNCGCRTCIEEANFCPRCGVILYFEEAEMVGRR